MADKLTERSKTARFRTQTATAIMSTTDPETSSASSSSDSDSSSDSQSTQSEDTQLDDLATTICTKWSPEKLITDFEEKYELLTEISTDILNVMFNAMQKENDRSIYLTNDAFKELLRAWPNWSAWIPTDNCGLHKKFKMNTGVLHYLLISIESIQSNEQELSDLNARIDDDTDYEDLEDMLDYGMFLWLSFL